MRTLMLLLAISCSALGSACASSSIDATEQSSDELSGGAGVHASCGAKVPYVAPAPNTPIDTLLLSGIQTFSVKWPGPIPPPSPIDVEIQGPGLNACLASVSCLVVLTSIKINGAAIGRGLGAHATLSRQARQTDGTNTVLNFAASRRTWYRADELEFNVGLNFTDDKRPFKLEGHYDWTGSTPDDWFRSNVELELPTSVCLPTVEQMTRKAGK